MNCTGDNPRYMNNIKSVLDGKCEDVRRVRCEYGNRGFQTTYPLCLSGDTCESQEIANIKIEGVQPLICKAGGYRTVKRDEDTKG